MLLKTFMLRDTNQFVSLKLYYLKFYEVGKHLKRKKNKEN